MAFTDFYDAAVSAIGVDSTLRLLAKFGGRSVTIPGLDGSHEGCKVYSRIMKLRRYGATAELIAEHTRLELATVIDVLEEVETFKLE